MEKILKILKIEKKVSRQGKPFTRYETSEGWMSCFKDEVIAQLESRLMKTCCIEMTENPEKGYKTIVKFVSDVEGAVEEINVREVEAKAKDHKNTTMYTSYAKDIFIAIQDKFKEPKIAMENAIALVKQAKKEFE